MPRAKRRTHVEDAESRGSSGGLPVRATLVERLVQGGARYFGVDILLFHIPRGQQALVSRGAFS